MAINRELSQLASLINVDEAQQKLVGISTNLRVSGFTTITGSLEANGLKFPQVDGLKGQVFVTDGQGNVGWTTSNSFYEKRVYVSTTGDDADDGKTLPVRTIKRAAQIASHSKDPVTIVIETGEYLEDNPIIIYDNVSIAGDNLRNTIIRPLNAGKDIFRLRNACYIFGVTMKDYVQNNVPQYTFNYGVAFDDIDDPLLSRVGYAGTQVSVSNVSYAHTTGITTVTTSSPHDFRVNQTVRLAGIAFTCNYGSVGINSFKYDHPTGISTAVTATNHNLSVGDQVFLKGLEFSCAAQHAGITTTIFPDGTSPYGRVFTVTNVGNSTTFTFNAGISTIAHTYVSGGIAQKALIYPEENPDRWGKDFPVVSVQSPTQFTLRCGITTIPHFYTQGGTAKIGKTLITQSPYVQNCSVISFLGANGVEVDGSKVATINEPVFAQEAENPQSGDIPDYGKSIVANAYTMVSFGGVGWRTINDGYAQVVSCFQIFCQDGSLCESGGYLSITNSATNFGTNALRAKGFSRSSYPFDRGLVAKAELEDVTQVMKVIGLGRKEQELYVIRIFNSSGQDVTNDFKPVGVAVTFDGVSGVNLSTNYITSINHGLDQGDTVAYYPNSSTSVGGLSTVTQYYASVLNTNTFKLFKDDSLTVEVDLTATAAGVHTFRKKNVEYFANEVRTTSNNAYQRLTLSGTPPFTFVPGRLVQQNIGTGITAFGYVLDFNSSNSTITVTNEIDYLGDRYGFSPTGGSFGTLNDHTATPKSTTINSATGISTYYTLDYTVGNTISGQSIQNFSSLPENYYVRFHRPSIVNSSSHTWEYAGSGNDYNALPQNGGVANSAKEQVAQKGGRVYTSGTNELGDFKIGNFIVAKNRTGNITFSNTVSIGEITSLSFSLGSGVVVNSISADPGLGDNDPGGAADSRLSTQKATRTFLNDRLGAFIDKDVSASSIPNRVPLLNASGKLNTDLIPPPSPSNFYFSSVGGGRTTLVNDIPANNLKAGDIVVENTGVTTVSYQLSNDVDSQYLVIGNSTDNHTFNTGTAVTGSSSGAVGIVTIPTSVGYGTTGLVKGVLVGGSLTYGGTGYNVAGTYDVALVTNTGAGTSARALVVVGAGGSVTSVDINFGGRGYVVGDTLQLSSGLSITGVDYATVGVTSVQTRLYTKLANRIKFSTSDNAIGIGTIVPVISEVNTSSASTSNYTVVSTTNIDASNIVSGTVSPSRLGSGTASIDTFLAGNSSYRKVITSVGIATTEPVNISSTAGFDNSTPGITTYYGGLNLSLSRADDLTVPSNDYGNLGVARFKKSTFAIGPNGAIRIKSTAESGDVDAATLGGNAGSFYLDQANFTSVTPITKGGTGLSALPANGAVLIGNGSVYNLTINPTIGGVLSANGGFNGSLYSSGISTSVRFDSTSANLTNLVSTSSTITNLNVVGSASTFGKVQITSSGIVTATTGIITYYGDGQYLAGVGVGVQVNSVQVGTGLTQINIISAGSLGTKVGNTANIEISGIGTQWTTNTTGIVTTRNVGAGTVTANFPLTVGAVGVGTTSARIHGILQADTVQRCILNNYVEKINNYGNTGSTPTFNLADGLYIKATLNQTVSSMTFNTANTDIGNGAIGFTLELKNGTGGPYGIAWPGSVRWAGGTTPTRTETAGQSDVWTFVSSDGGTTWIGSLALINYSL